MTGLEALSHVIEMEEVAGAAERSGSRDLKAVESAPLDYNLIRDRTSVYSICMTPYGWGHQRASFCTSIAAEVEQHKGKNDCWIVYKEMVRRFSFEVVSGWLHCVYVPNAT